MARKRNKGIRYPKGWPVKPTARYPNGWPGNMRAALYLNNQDDSQWGVAPEHHGDMKPPHTNPPVDVKRGVIQDGQYDDEAVWADDVTWSDT